MKTPSKFLIQMSGAPGSGKSTMANLLSREVDAVVINHDLIKAFFLESNFGFDQSSKLTYSFDWVLAEDMIKQGRSVIIDSTCNFDEALDQGTALAKRYGYEYKYVECRVTDIDLLDQRLRNRVPMRSQRASVATPPLDSVSAGQNNEDPRERFMRWIAHPCRPTENPIIVDMTNDVKKALDDIMRFIVPPAGLQAGTTLAV